MTTRTIARTLLMLFAATFAVAQTPQVIDRVVAVVNNQPVLLSDVEDTLELSVLEPASHTLSRAQALDQLISRILIQQQIRQQDEKALEPTPEEFAKRMSELRKELPACRRFNCTTDDGWQSFLVAHQLTEARVQAYLHLRLEIMRFIELRFRQGIRIEPGEGRAYYQQTLLPLYAPGDTPPGYDAVAPRIEEILLQQRVNILFSDWLENLRKQGDVEVLDPAFLPPASTTEAHP